MTDHDTQCSVVYDVRLLQCTHRIFAVLILQTGLDREEASRWKAYAAIEGTVRRN